MMNEFSFTFVTETDRSKRKRVPRLLKEKRDGGVSDMKSCKSRGGDVDTVMDRRWCGTSGPKKGTAGKTQLEWNGQGHGKHFLQKYSL